MSNPFNYGSRFWAITGEGAPLYLNADSIEVMPNGCLVAWGGYREDGEISGNERIALYGIAAGQWQTFYAASVLTGDIVCAEKSN